MLHPQLSPRFARLLDSHHNRIPSPPRAGFALLWSFLDPPDARQALDAAGAPPDTASWSTLPDMSRAFFAGAADDAATPSCDALRLDGLPPGHPAAAADPGGAGPFFERLAAPRYPLHAAAGPQFLMADGPSHLVLHGVVTPGGRWWRVYHEEGDGGRGASLLRVWTPGHDGARVAAAYLPQYATGAWEDRWGGGGAADDAAWAPAPGVRVQCIKTF